MIGKAMAKCTNVGNFGEKGWKTDRNMVKHGERIMEIWVKHGKQKCWKTRNISEKMVDPEIFRDDWKDIFWEIYNLYL